MVRTKRKNERRHQVGKYVADYSPVTQEELNAPDPELEALYARSKPVSRRSEIDEGDGSKS